MSRYLVTGAAGFLGRSVVKSLLAHGHEVRAMVQREADSRHVRAPRATIIAADVLDPKSLLAAIAGAEIVVHCAAKVPGKAGPDEIWSVNVHGTANVVAACVSGGVRRLVYISTDSVYGDESRSAATEESPLNPAFLHEGNYPQSKVEAERLVLDAARKHDLEVTIIRPCLMYGPDDCEGRVHLYHWAGKRVHLLIGGGECLISMTFVTDAAEAIELAAESPAAAGRIYNISDGVPHSKREIFEAIAQVKGQRKVYVSIPGRPLYWLVRGLHAMIAPINPGIAARLDPRRILFSISHHAVEIGRIRSELGYEPRVSLREGLRRTFDFVPPIGTPLPAESQVQR